MSTEPFLSSPSHPSPNRNYNLKQKPSHLSSTTDFFYFLNQSKATMSHLIAFLSTSRIALGTLSLLFPSPTLSLFQLPIQSPALLPTRLFGIRDAVLGGLLWTADSPAAVRRALIAGAIVDGIDVLSVAYGMWKGDMDVLAADLVGGAALMVMAMGLWALRRPIPLTMGKL